MKGFSTVKVIFNPFTVIQKKNFSGSKKRSFQKIKAIFFKK